MSSGPSSSAPVSSDSKQQHDYLRYSTSLAEFFDFLSCAYRLNSDLNDKTRQKIRISADELSSNRLVSKLLGTAGDCRPEKGPWKTKARARRLGCGPEEPINPKSLKSSASIEDITDHLNAHLESVLNEGILDSVMPFIVPKLNFAETAVKVKNMEQSKKQEELQIQQTTKEYLGIMKHGGIETKGPEADIEIQVCDELRHKTKVFKCARSLLLSQMAYFADVTSGQRLEDMDISVHCDLTIFEWLMKWVKSTQNNENVPVLHNLNVIPVLVSATFLQMNPLIQECISYFKVNMDDVIKSASPNLSCLNDAVIAKIADALTNLELDGMDDQKDKIQSRLFCKFIVLLARKDPQYFRGHFSSISLLFKCNLCKKILHAHFACWIPCLQNNVKLDSSGIMQALHEMDEYWNINFFIKDLKSEVKSWRKVYWRVWGTCHYLKCLHCSSYYPVKSTNWCRHHDQFPQFFPAEEGKQVSIVEKFVCTTVRPSVFSPAQPAREQQFKFTDLQNRDAAKYSNFFTIGKHMCCGQKTYRFEILPTFSGCNFRPHQPLIPPQQQMIAKILERKSELIFVNPPRLSIRINLLKEIDHYCEGASRIKDEPDIYSDSLKNEYFSWYNLQLIPTFVHAHLHREPPSLDLVEEDVEEEELQDTESGSSSSKQNQFAFDPKEGYYSSTDDIDSSSIEDEDLSDEDSPAQTNATPKCCKRYKRCSHKRKLKYNKRWMPKLSVRCNQDNQREREERLMKSYVQKLSRRGVNSDLSKIQKCTVVIPRACMSSSVPMPDPILFQDLELSLNLVPVEMV